MAAFSGVGDALSWPVLPGFILCAINVRGAVARRGLDGRDSGRKPAECAPRGVMHGDDLATEQARDLCAISPALALAEQAIRLHGYNQLGVSLSRCAGPRNGHKKSQTLSGLAFLILGVRLPNTTIVTFFSQRS